jgi:2-oxo-4-hydroxy-4-carboxy--5-ureidoimidazoline (OHCU) decarboxylase
MLAILRERLSNHPDTELRTAAGEQARITQLRLKKLIETPDSRLKTG